MTGPASSESAGGESACWADRVCQSCGSIPDRGDLDASGRCAECGDPAPLTDDDYRNLAEFRASLRAFLRSSEDAAREAGVTPNQHQLLLAIRGWAGQNPPSVTDLADRLQLQVHSTGELLARAEDAGLVTRRADPGDARRSQVALTDDGAGCLEALSAFHRDQLRHLRRRILAVLADLDG